MSEQVNSVAGQLVGIPVGQVYTAGKGIKIDNVNKVVSVDETVLFDTGTNNAANSGATSEAYTNFERLYFEVGVNNQTGGQDGYQWSICSPRSEYMWVNFMYGQGGTNHYYATAKIHWTDATHFTVTNASAIMHTETSTGVVGNTSNNTATKTCIFKIVGVNRISGGNQ